MTLPELAIKRPVTTLMVIVSLVVLGGVGIILLVAGAMVVISRGDIGTILGGGIGIGA